MLAGHDFYGQILSNRTKQPVAGTWAPPPRVAGARARAGRGAAPALPALADEVIAAVEEAVPEYRDGVAENVRLGVRQALDGFVELVLTGSDASLPERQIYVEFGRGEYRVGRSLDALLTAYRAGAQVAWRGLADAGDQAGLEPRSLYTLAEAVFAYIDEISAASAEGFAREQTLAAGPRSRPAAAGSSTCCCATHPPRVSRSKPPPATPAGSRRGASP